jgi:HD-GYP domain-containing protein (c-di-GMP phosphodiesterase class II)
MSAMRFVPLSAVLHRVAVGQPLVLNVYDTDGSLLLSKGTTVDTPTQLDALASRGVQVDLEEVPERLEVAAHVPRDMLPALWQDATNRVLGLLHNQPLTRINEALSEACQPLEVLIRRDPDLAIVNAVRNGLDDRRTYGVLQSMYAAVVSMLIATRLGWAASEVTAAGKTALAMNVSIFKLLGSLALRRAAPSADERQVLRAHPIRSRELLVEAGVRDRDLLLAVEQHHERADGTGYPGGIKAVADLAALVRCADAFVTGLHDYSGPGSQAPDQLLKRLFLQEERNMFVAALVKEMGIYPPGCVVDLANGEQCLVIRRGASINSPVVAAIPNATKRQFGEAALRDTTLAQHRIVRVVHPSDHLIGKSQMVTMLRAQ